MRFALAAGALFGFLGVAFGAFGAHALRDRLDASSLAIYQTGVQYQFVHALALVAIGLSQRDGKPLRWAAMCFAVGVPIFSGSLFALALSGVKVLGAIAPFGGLAFLAGWALLIAHSMGGSSEQG